MSYLQKNILPYKSASLDGFVRVVIAGQYIGWTRPELASRISETDIWHFDGVTLALDPRFTDFDSRTRAIDDSMVALSDAGFLPVMPDYTALGGIDWFPVRADFDAEPVAIIKRFYAPYLGSSYDGVMLHGYHGNQYWTARRSMDVHDSPGMGDIISAGAIRHGDNVLQALEYEATVEAGLTPEQLTKAIQHPPIYLYYLNARGYLHHERFFIFDIVIDETIKLETQLPLEIGGFEMMPIERVINLVEQSTYFKGQINMVITDFLVRHGYLDNHPEFADIKHALYLKRDI